LAESKANSFGKNVKIARWEMPEQHLLPAADLGKHRATPVGLPGKCPFKGKSRKVGGGKSR